MHPYHLSLQQALHENGFDIRMTLRFGVRISFELIVFIITRFCDLMKPPLRVMET